MTTNQEAQLSTPVRASRSGLFFAVFTFFCLLLLAGLLVYWEKLLKSEIRHLQRASVQQQQLILQLQTNLQSLNLPQQKKIRTLTEASYLLRSANFELQFQGDVPTTIHLLQTADSEIAGLEDPTLLPIRQSVAEHLATLQSANKLDLTGILLQLNAINGKIYQLPLITGQLPNVTNQKKTSDQSSSSSHYQPGNVCCNQQNLP